MKLTFNRDYFLLTVLLLLTEVLIGIYMHDAYVRPYGGDFLVVILIYCFVHSFFALKVLPSAIVVLLFAYIVETLQYFHFVKALGLEQYTAARVIMGTNFEWTDLLMYTLGILWVLLIEIKLLHKTLN